MQGEKGDKGDQGEQGLQGEKGDKGEGVKSAYIDENGDLIVTLTSDEVINAGSVINKENPQKLAFYPLDDGTYAVGGGNAICLSSITIPSTYKGKAVTSIYSFYGFKGNTVIIPESIKTINEYAFAECFNLSEILIPNSVTDIEKYAFAGCSNLTEITVPNNVKNIGEYAFYNCRNLTTINIPNSITVLEKGIFEGCSSLSSIVLPEELTKISDCAFKSCISLTEITFPDSLVYVGIEAFLSSGLLDIYANDYTNWYLPSTKKVGKIHGYPNQTERAYDLSTNKVTFTFSSAYYNASYLLNSKSFAIAIKGNPLTYKGTINYYGTTYGGMDVSVSFAGCSFTKQ